MVSPALTPVQRFAGRAFTVRLPQLDSTALHYALDLLSPGDVVVVQASADDDRASFGGVVGLAAKTNGAIAAVVDGMVTDRDDLVQLGIPIFSRGVSARTTRLLGIEGAINVPVSIGGSIVNPGDIVFGDSDGVAIVSPSEAESVADMLEAADAVEAKLRSVIKAGGSLARSGRAAKLFESNMAPTA